MINPFRRSYTVEEQNLFRFLRSNRFFAELTNSEIYYFLPYMYLREYKKNEVVFFRGDPSQAFYIVKSGLVSLNVELRGKMELLTTLASSETFGENSMLYDTKRIHNAIVESEFCELYVIPQTNILDVFENHVEVKAKMLEALSEQYNEYTINLFRAYQSSFGFFDLGQVYNKF
jgi:CRP/FNR family cyclic AMP-dependent transcriptional regulator